MILKGNRSQIKTVIYSKAELEAKKELALETDRLLYQKFGEPQPQKDNHPLDILIRTVLSQSTSDHNRDMAFARFKQRFPDWESALNASPQEIAAAIMPGGLANQKSQRIKDILRWVRNKSAEFNLDWLNDINLDEAISELTSLKGVGVKTAAVLMCFAFDAEIFPVDVHIHRICRRLGLSPEKASAERTHWTMQPLIPAGRAKPFHLNLLKLGRTYCRPSKPNCRECPLSKICQFYKLQDEEN